MLLLANIEFKRTIRGNCLPSDQLSEKEREQIYLGILQFNKQEFFECHETLEKIWLNQEGETKELLQGLIQIAVGYHHMLKGNLNGALNLLKRGLTRVAKHKSDTLGLALSDLCETVQSNLATLETNPEARINPASIPRVRFL